MKTSLRFGEVLNALAVRRLGIAETIKRHEKCVKSSRVWARTRKALNRKQTSWNEKKKETRG
jgi:hypothetical protein